MLSDAYERSHNRSEDPFKERLTDPDEEDRQDANNESHEHPGTLSSRSNEFCRLVLGQTTTFPDPVIVFVE